MLVPKIKLSIVNTKIYAIKNPKMLQRESLRLPFLEINFFDYFIHEIQVFISLTNLLLLPNYYTHLFKKIKHIISFPKTKSCYLFSKVSYNMQCSDPLSVN